MTLTKIAKLSNVSISTASKAFSMSSEVSEETRKIVFETAKKHHCFRQFYNAKYPKIQIAVISPETKSYFYSSIIDALCEKLGKRNCEICISSTDFDKKKAEDSLQYYDKYATVDAVILLETMVDSVSDYSVPIVSLTRKAIPGISNVVVDSEKCFSEAVLSLKDANITKIGYIGESYTVSKKASIMKAMEQTDITIDDACFITTEKRFEAGGYDAAMQMIDKKILPDAIICAYDYMAIGAIRALHDNGYQVPEDISVIGVDNIKECAYLVPSLSSIGFSINEICDGLVRLLFDGIENKPCETLTVTGEFFKRQSQR